MSKSNEKKLAVLGLCIIMALVVLTGCGSKEAVNQNTRGEDNSAKQVLTISDSFFPSNLDPAQAWNGWYAVKYGIGETLVKLNKNMKLEPWVAKSWQRIDELNWKIDIRDGVKFHNGKEVTAKTVKASLQRVLETNSRTAQLLDIDNMKVQGKTLIIKTNKPNPAFISNLVDPSTAIIDAAAAKSMGKDFEKKPVMTGPFKPVKFLQDTKAVLKKNEDYWGNSPHIDEAVFKDIPDANTRIMSLQAGEIDVARSIPSESLKIFDESSDYNIISASSTRSHILIFNLKKPVFKEKEVRKAINYAINRKVLAENLMAGMGIAAVGPYPLVMPFGGEDLDGYTFNREKAERILEEAGWNLGPDKKIRKKGNNKLEFTITTYGSRPELPLIAEALQSQLGDVGIKVNVEIVENISDMLSNGNFQSAIYSMNTAVTGDPQYFLEIFFKTNADSNFGGYSNSNLNQLINNLQTAFGMEERYKIAKEAQQIILDDAAFAFLVYPKQNTVLSSNIKGLDLYPTEFYFLDSDVRME